MDVTENNLFQPEKKKNMLSTRRLGRTDLKVTIIGLGGIPLTGTDDSTSDKVINRALII